MECGFSQSVVLPNSVITFEKSFYAHFAKLFSSSLERDIPLCQFHNFSINLKLFQSKNYEMGGKASVYDYLHVHRQLLGGAQRLFWKGDWVGSLL